MRIALVLASRVSFHPATNEQSTWNCPWRARVCPLIKWTTQYVHSVCKTRSRRGHRHRILSAAFPPGDPAYPGANTLNSFHLLYLSVWFFEELGEVRGSPLNESTHMTTFPQTHLSGAISIRNSSGKAANPKCKQSGPVQGTAVNL